MISVYGIRFQAIQSNYHEDGNKVRYISELRNLALDIRRKLSPELEGLLTVVERTEDYLQLVRENYKTKEVIL